MPLSWASRQTWASQRRQSGDEDDDQSVASELAEMEGGEEVDYFLSNNATFTVRTAEGFFDLFDPDAPASLLATTRWLRFFNHHEVESLYLQHSIGKGRHLLSVVGITSFSVIFLYHFGLWPADYGWGEFAALLFGSAILFAAVVNWIALRWKQLKPNRDSTAVRVYEACVVFTFLSFCVSIPLVVFSRATICLTEDQPGNRHLGCRHSLYPHAAIGQIFPALMYLPRPVFHAPAMVLELLAIIVGAKIEGGVATSVVLATFLYFALINSVIAEMLVQDSVRSRSTFVAWVQLQRAKTRAAREEANAIDALRSMLPDTTFSRLLAGEAAFETSEWCTVSVWQPANQGRWCNTTLVHHQPVILDHLFTAFDTVLKLRDELRKFKSAGDRYIVGAHLWPRGDARMETSPGIGALACVAFAVQQYALTTRTRLLAQNELFFASIGIHTGKCYGGLIGTRALWYEVHGEALEVALRVASVGASDVVTVTTGCYDCAATLCSCHSYVSPWANDLGPRCAVLHEVQIALAPADGDDAAEHRPPVPAAPSSAAKEGRLRLLYQRIMLSQSIAPFDVDSDPYRAAEELKETLNAQISSARWRLAATMRWSVLFDDEALQERYEAFEGGARAAAYRATAAFLGVCGTLLVVAIAEDTLTIASASILMAAMVVRAARHMLFSARPTVLGVPGLEFAFVAIVFSLPFFAIALLPPQSILNGRTEYLFIVLQTVAIRHLESSRWLRVFAIQLLFTLLGLFLEYIISDNGLMLETWGLSNFSMYLGIIGYSAFSQESRRIARFRDSVVSQAFSTAIANQARIRSGLLAMIAPVQVANMLRSKVVGLTRAVQHLSDTNVAFIRLANIVPPQIADEASLLAAVESTYAAVETVLTKSAGLIERIHTIGDELLLAGPLLCSTELLMEATLRSRRSIKFNHLQRPDERGDLLLLAADAMLDVVMGLIVAGKSPTCCLHCETGVAAVVGTSPPVFDLFGPAVRTAEAIARAMVPGTVVMTDRFSSLLTNGGVEFPRDEGDFTRGTPASWSLAVAGVCSVTTLLPPSSINQPVPFPPT